MPKDNDKTSKRGSKETSSASNKSKKNNPERRTSQSMVVQSSNKAKEAKKDQDMSDEELLAAIRPKHSTEKPSSNSSYSKAQEEQAMESDHHKENSTPASQGRLPLGTLLGLSALVLAAVIGIWNFQQGSHFSELEQQIQEIQGQSNRVDDSLNQWQIVQGELQSEYKASMDGLAEQVTSQMERMSQLGARQDWKLHEARYLIVLAHERLQAFDDVQTAKALLEGADQRVKSVLEPGTRTVREAIAKDITKIESVNKLDIEGLWANLGALAQQLESLEFLSLTDPDNRASQPQEEDAQGVQQNQESSGWREALNKSWQEVKGLVKVREFKTEQLDNILTRPQQEQLIYTLKLLVEEARWAVLYRNQAIYDQSLQTLEKQIQEYFVQNTAFQNVQFKLQQLQQNSLSVEWPNLSNSIQALDALMADQGLSQPSALSQPSTSPLTEKPSQVPVSSTSDVETQLNETGEEVTTEPASSTQLDENSEATEPSSEQEDSL